MFSRNAEVEKIIKLLKEKVKLVLLSNTNEWQYEYSRKKYKVIDFFDEHVLSYKLGIRKPNPFIFLEAIKKSGTMPWNCLYFDDIPEFVYVARMMRVMAFQYKNVEKLKEALITNFI